MLKVGKVLVLSLLVVGLCAPLASATTSRVKALAGASNYINDDSDIFRWYGTLPSYSKMVMAEVGDIAYSAEGSYYQALGFTHNWGEDHPLGTWGVFLLRNSIEDGSYYLFNPLFTPGDLPSTKFALTWGKDLGKVALGIMFTRSDVMVKTDVESKYNFMTIGAGVRWDASETMYGDAAVTVGLAGGDNIFVDATNAGGFDKKTSYNFEGRMFWEFTDNATLVPYVGYKAAEFALEYPGVTPAVGDGLGVKWSDFTIGSSLNFDVNTNNMLVFAADLEWFNQKPSKVAAGDQEELSATVLPRFYVALESDITSWFTARVGANKTMTAITEKASDGTESIYTNTELFPGFDDFAWFLGGGFHIGEWDIDAVFDPAMPFRLGYWLTGYNSSDPPVGRVSATYRF